MLIPGKSVICRLARPWWVSHLVLFCYFQPGSLCNETQSKTLVDSGALLSCKRAWVSQLCSAGTDRYPPRRVLGEQALVNLTGPSSLGSNPQSFTALNLPYLAQMGTGVDQWTAHGWIQKRKFCIRTVIHSGHEGQTSAHVHRSCLLSKQTPR